MKDRKPRRHRYLEALDIPKAFPWDRHSGRDKGEAGGLANAAVLRRRAKENLQGRKGDSEGVKALKWLGWS